jgi:hypothetical protein
MVVSMKEKIRAKLLRSITFETASLLCEGRKIPLAADDSRLTQDSGKLYAHAIAAGVIFRGSSGGRFVDEDGR